MPRRLSFEEACRFADSLPDSIFLNYVTGKPMVSRTEWEALPRWRRLRDVILFRHPRRPNGRC